ncbi:hypothetical protein PCLA_02r0265 [Pseudomonas citronellolis]|nr:hypothetical protein PCLA_02r0265 [Pseudomonas citronellolis]
MNGYPAGLKRVWECSLLYASGVDRGTPSQPIGQLCPRRRPGHGLRRAGDGPRVAPLPD